MFVEVELNFQTSYYFGGRAPFWRTFEEKRLGGGERRESDLDPSLIDNYEGQFKLRFPRILEQLVNSEIERALGSRTADHEAEKAAVPPKIKIRLVAVQYASIKPILDILGIENADLRDFVLMSLSIYVPQAFNQAMNTNLDMVASATLLGDVPTIRSGTPSPTLSARTNDVVSRTWMIANGTLVVPVLLSLAVFYFAFKESSSQATDLKAERTEIVKALTEQNKAISASIVEQAKEAAANGKAMQDAVIKIMTEKANGATAMK
jgi:hypothetical protein